MAIETHLPANTGALQLSAALSYSITLTDRDYETGETSVAGHHDLPAGVRRICVQSRMCGDWYAEIEGERHVAGFAPTKNDAFLVALGKAAA